MIGTDITTTGAAGAAPMPVFVVRPSLRDGVVAIAPTVAPQQGTGLPAVRPWGPALTGSAARFAGSPARKQTTDLVGARDGGYAQHTPCTTPGAQPPRRPLA